MNSKLIKRLCIFFIIIFFLFPIFNRNCEIGLLKFNRVIVRYYPLIGMVYEKTVYYLYQDDYILVKDEINTESNSCKECILTQDILLKSNNNQVKYPTYILPKGIGACITSEHSKDGNGEAYGVQIITYEKDGKKKIYQNFNISKDSFIIQEKNTKYLVFSRFGNHYIKKDFVYNVKLNFIDWYLKVLSIQFSYFTTLFLKTTSYFEEINDSIGFNNFK